MNQNVFVRRLFDNLGNTKLFFSLVCTMYVACYVIVFFFPRNSFYALFYVSFDSLQKCKLKKKYRKGLSKFIHIQYVFSDLLNVMLGKNYMNSYRCWGFYITFLKLVTKYLKGLVHVSFIPSQINFSLNLKTSKDERFEYL